MVSQSWVIMMEATPKSMLTKAFNISYKSHLLYIYVYIYMYIYIIFIYLFIYTRLPQGSLGTWVIGSNPVCVSKLGITSFADFEVVQ